MSAEKLFDEICENTKGVTRSVMFGAPCLKTPNGKAAVCYYKGSLVVKLDKKDLDEVMSWDGAGPFDPAGGRPMNGWVQVGFEYKKKWQDLTNKAVKFVGALEAKPAKGKKK